jgi:hypothetical protein
MTTLELIDAAIAARIVTVGDHADDPIMAALRPARSDLTRLTASNAELVGLLELFVDDEPCQFDHHGTCQEHMNMLDGRCVMKLARQALANAKETK